MPIPEKSQKRQSEIKDKCLETSLLKEFKTYKGGSKETSKEFQSLPMLGYVRLGYYVHLNLLLSKYGW